MGLEGSKREGSRGEGGAVSEGGGERERETETETEGGREEGEGPGFIQASRCRMKGLEGKVPPKAHLLSGSGFRVKDLGRRVKCLGRRVQGVGFRV